MNIRRDGGEKHDVQDNGSRLDSCLTKESSAWLRYGAAILAVGFGMLLDEADLLSGGFRLYLVFYPFIVIATLFGGLGPGLLAIVLSALSATFFLAEPVGRFAIAARADLVSMAVFIVGSLVIVLVCERLRSAIRRAALAEAKTASAAELARKAQLLEEVEQRLTMAQKAGQVGLFDWDITNDKVVWTPEQEKLFGAPVGQFEETYGIWVKRVHPEDEARLTLFFEQWMQSGPEKESWEYRILQPDGEIRWIDARGILLRDGEGKAVRMIGTNRDITERKMAEEALQESESRCWAILDTMVDAMIIIDEQGIIDFVNPAAVKLFGYQPSEMKGQNITMLMPSPHDEQHDGYLEAYRLTGERKIIGIARKISARHKNGSIFPIRLAVSEIHIGKKRLLIGQIHDLTEREGPGEAPRQSEG